MCNWIFQIIFRQNFEEGIAHKVREVGGEEFYRQEIDKLLHNITFMEEADSVTCKFAHM